MTTATLADLRRLYYGGGSAAEYDFLKSAADAGITALTALQKQQTVGWRKIAEQKLVGASVAIDIAGIDQSFRHLKILASLRGDNAAAFSGVHVNINNDQADANYFNQRLQGNAAAASAQENLGGASSRAVGLVAAATAPAGHFSLMEITIPDYADGTKIKAMKVETFSTWGITTGTILSRFNTLIRNNVEAVNRVALAAQAGNLVTGSVMSVYAIESPFG